MNYQDTIIPFNENPKRLTNDVADTLGVQPHELAYNRPCRLCVDDRVNMFSLNKPLWRTCDFHSDDPDWQKGAMNYGIIIPSPTTIDNLPNSKWGWDKPTGGATSPYRLEDFVGYKHKCPTPYYKVPKEIYTNKDLQNNKVTACYPMSDTYTVGFDKYKVQLSSASSGNQNFYAAIWIRDQSNDGGYIKTHHSVISGGEDKIEFDLHGLPQKYQQGQLQVCCFITNKLQVDWVSATRLPLDFLSWGGYGTVNYTTYVTTFKFPAELSTWLDRSYTFIDSAEPVDIVIKNIRTDGKSIDLRGGATSNVKIKYEVTSATGDTAKVESYGCRVVSGSPVIAPNQTCTIRFDKMLGYTVNGQPSFPPSGFRGNCYATLWYQRINDIGTSSDELLININIPLISLDL